MNSLSMRRARQYAGCILGVIMMSLAACGSVLTPVPLTPTMTLDATSVRGIATPTIAPESYLTPLPPTPTFTPSPTPTPVVHIVEEGDTLFGVALEYGVTVEGLLRANALSEQDYLSIGQTLIIPLGDEEEVEDPQMLAGNMILPTPTPLPLTTSSVALYQTPVGGLWCLGEVVNTTTGPVTNLQVEVTLVAQDGTPLGRGRALAAADYLAPGERAPFSVLFREPPNGVADAEVQVMRGESISAITAGFVPLRIEAVEGGVSGPQYRVRGSVVNDSDFTLTDVSVVATIYGNEGDVVGYRQVQIAEDAVLAPGQQQFFDVLLTPQGVEPPSDFGVVAWGIAG